MEYEQVSCPVHMKTPIQNVYTTACDIDTYLITFITLFQGGQVARESDFLLSTLSKLVLAMFLAESGVCTIIERT